jgi:serpin B
MDIHHFVQKTARLFLLLALMVTGCTAQPSVPVGQIAESKLVRLVNPQIALGDQQTLADDNRAFAADLYQKLRAQDGNLFFSPYSISLALAMTYAGARGETASQMAAAMHFTLPQERLHPAFNALDQYLSSLSESTNTSTPAPSQSAPQGFQLSIANAIWGQKGFDFLPAYLDLLAQNYGAGMRLADFAGDPQAARQAINAWVSQQTKDKIKDLVPQGTIDSNTRLALVNAIYFKASWLYSFPETDTQDGVFFLQDGSQVSVPMMSSSQTATLYERGSDFQAVGLPYYGGKTMMVVVLPDEGKFETFDLGMDELKLGAILNGLESSSVELILPKFKLEASFSLPDTLSAMGMTDAFDGGKADFSGMDGRRDLYISDVLHKAFISVDEKGTEAAAATLVAMRTSAMLNTPLVRVDRPFLFFIYDLGSSTVLFAGRLMNPAP